MIGKKPNKDGTKAERAPQVDSKSMASKIELRRWLLRRMNLESVRVLDVCTGDGKIWTAMRKHVEILRWTRCDQKIRPHQHQESILQMEASETMRRLPLSEYDVVDIDPYSDCFGAYFIMLPRLTRRTAVFLTHGHFLGTVKKTSTVQIGLPPEWDCPRTPEFGEYVAKRSLELTWNYAVINQAAKIDAPRGMGQAMVAYYALDLSPLGA